MARRRSGIAVVGEKIVKETSREVGVKPLKRGPDARRPMPARALDRRREVSPGGPVGMSRSEAKPAMARTTRRGTSHSG